MQRARRRTLPRKGRVPLNRLCRGGLCGGHPMRRLFLLLLLVPAPFVPPTFAVVSAEAPVKLTLIKSGGILDVRAGKILPDRGILVESDRIKEIRPLAGLVGRLPEGTTVIDLGQAILLPGLFDCHAHLRARGRGERRKPESDAGQGDNPGPPADWTAEAFLGYVKASLVLMEVELKEWDRWMDKKIATSTDRLRRA